MSQHIIIGPRAIRNQERYLQQALKQKRKEQQNELQSLQQNSLIYESTASAAEKHAREQLQIIATAKRNDLTVSNQQDGGEENEHAITFWSHNFIDKKTKRDVDRAGCQMHDMLAKKRTSFAKCTSFTNDIRDGRLQHASD